MTFKAALIASLRQALLFAALFAALTLVGDLYWERPIDWIIKAISVAVAFIVFWALIAFKMKVKSQ